LALLDALPRSPARYVFSEPSPVFRQRGAAALAEHHAAVEACSLDVDRPLDAQAVSGRFELVYAVNVLHVARDLVAALRALRERLTPGGALVLGETVRPAHDHPLPLELVFHLTPAFQTVHRVPGLRESPGFLPWASWDPLLRRAGFREVALYPEPGRALAVYPGTQLVAIVARP